MNTQKNCKARWADHKNSRISDLKKLWKSYQEGEDSAYYKRISEELGDFNEYGLCFDYVAPETFTDQLEGFWRYQISTGGPGEEFRFYASSPESPCYRLTFVFLDWFDGHERNLTGKDLELMTEIWEFFQEIGSTEHEFEKSMND